MDENKVLLNKCKAFHGHICGGLVIGYKAALYAIELLELPLGEGEDAGCLSCDEEIVCIAENDACGVDAIQVILGCSVGKGNLLFHIRGKQAFSFYNRMNGKAVRLSLKPKSRDMTEDEYMNYYLAMEPKDMFDVMEPRIQLPAEATVFDSYPCACCGENTGSNWLRVMNGKMVCLDCCETYDRFQV